MTHEINPVQARGSFASGCEKAYADAADTLFDRHAVAPPLRLRGAERANPHLPLAGGRQQVSWG